MSVLRGLAFVVLFPLAACLGVYGCTAAHVYAVQQELALKQALGGARAAPSYPTEGRLPARYACLHIGTGHVCATADRLEWSDVNLNGD